MVMAASNSITSRGRLVGNLSSNNIITGTVDTAYNPAYALVTESGNKIILHINNNNYKLYAELLNKNDEIINISNTIDLPLESMVVNGRYDSTTKKLILVLDNGNEIEIPLGALINGLVSTEELAETLTDYVQFTDYASAVKSGVIKVSDSYATTTENGALTSQTKTYSDYEDLDNNAFISKGTLENVITGKELINKDYVDTTDEKFEEDLFGSPFIEEENTRIILNNTTESALNNIELKSNDISQTTTLGKNKFNKADFKAVGRATYSYSEGVYTITPLGTGNASLILNINLPAGTYTYQGYSSGTVQIRNSSNSNLVSNINSTNTTFTISETGTSIVFNWGTGTSTTVFTVDMNNIQIEEGSIATSYEEYTYGSTPNPQYPQQVKVISGDNNVKIQNNNILNPSDYISGGADVIFSNNILKVYSTRTNTSPFVRYTYDVQQDDIIRLNGIIQSSQGRFVLQTSVDGINYITVSEVTRNYVDGETISSIEYTIPENVTKVRFLLYSDKGVATGDTESDYKDVIITINNSNMTYVLHKGQNFQIALGDLEYCKIGSYEDLFFKNVVGSTYYDSTLVEDKWYLKKNIGKVVLDGSDDENWATEESRNTGNTFYATITIIDSSHNTSIDTLYSNYFKQISNIWTSDIEGIQRLNQYRSLRFRILKTSLSEVTINAFKNWLSTHNTEVYYVLQNPTYTLLSNTLQTQLENIYNTISYQGQTSVLQENDGLPFIIEISAFKDSTKGNISAIAAENKTQEYISNKVISINNNSTDIEYPSAKAVYTNSLSKEDKSNKVTELSSSSTDAQYPSAKAVYDIIGNIESLLEELDSGNGVS